VGWGGKLRERADGGNVMCDISLFRIVTMSSPLYNEYILIKIYLKGRKMKKRKRKRAVINRNEI
jgi:hypothetical protein